MSLHATTLHYSRWSIALHWLMLLLIALTYLFTWSCHSWRARTRNSAS